MKCSRCGRQVPEREIYTYRGETLCEDCYLDSRMPAKACDPWAVYSAKRSRETSGFTGEEGLTALQKAIYEFVSSKGKATREEVMEHLNLSKGEMDRQIATLRHCELVKGHKEGQRVYLVPFC